MTAQPTWVPQVCTLPTVEQPLRVAEFDELFAMSLRHVERLAPTRLRLTLTSGSAPMARDLAEREARCCSFFTFDVADSVNAVRVDIEVPAVHRGVLDGLATRAVAILETREAY